jgi:glycogen debranching enzyme
VDYRVIKENNTFLLTNLAGDIPQTQEPMQGFGLYNGDTRFMSCLELRINGQKPIVLSSEADQNYVSTILLTNPHMEQDGKLELWRESIELKRTRFIYADILYETITATNYSPYANTFNISLRVDADFADMFVVRGFMGGDLGKKSGQEVEQNHMAFGYNGADGVGRKLRVEWSKPADQVEPNGEVTFRMNLEAGQSLSIDFTFMTIIDGMEPKRVSRNDALEILRTSYDEWAEQSTSVHTDLPIYNELFQRGLQDIRVLLTDIGHGYFPVAGVPWFAVPFGRDSLIAALQLLPIHPEVAKGTLLTMAHYQGEKVDAWRDEQPGKIMHELRTGELTRTNQVPFSPYYGSIDSTPLFLVLLGEYIKWTDDFATLKRLMPNVLRALDWIAQYGHRDGSSFVSYFQESSKGIANQGWKDSADSVVHRSGEYAKAPIALVEVQGYVYQAKTTLASLFRSMQEEEGYEWLSLAARLSEEAENLRERFESEFWMESEQTYAIALDSDGKQVQSVTSNPGHVLMSGLYSPERAKAVVQNLVSPRMFSGYGIRTMAEGEKGYNPMSYHDGSIWPHDNSMCLIGMSTLGFRDEAGIVMEGLLRTAVHFENNRLPELFCGYSSKSGRPVRYPVACSPQAWAAATPLTFLHAMLGLRLDYQERSLHIRPSLPEGMSRIEIRGMRLGSGHVDLRVNRIKNGYDVEVLSVTGNWNIKLSEDNLSPKRKLLPI